MDGSSPAPAGSSPCRYWFAGFRLEADGTLLEGEKPLRLPPEELAVLRLLAARAGEIVSPRQLKRAVWSEERVSSDTVSKCIASLRARLQPADCIQSIYRRGYRFSAAVQTDGPRPAGDLPRLAILPFAVGYGVAEYLGSALAEETMAQLNGGHYAIASIVARDSVFTLARRGAAAHEIGKTLEADLVLSGRLEAEAGRRRLRAEMIRAEDGAQLWIEDFLVERGRFAEVSSELVNRLICRLDSGNVSIAAVAASSEARETLPEHDEVRELTLRAHHEWQTLERHRMQDAMGRLQRAIELDPTLMAARVDLAHLCVTQALFGFMPPTVAARLVRLAARDIPDWTGNAEALLPALGWIRFHVDRDLPAALEAFARSAHLPHDPWITRMRSMFLLSRHRFDEALGLLRAAIDADPYSAWLHARLAWALHLAEKQDASVDQIRKAISLFPEHDDTLFYGAMILACDGEVAHAVELAQALATRSPHFDLATAAHAYALACAGHAEEARTLLERLQWLSRERFVLNAFNAAVHVALGDPEAALDELRIANENRCPWFFQMLADPRLKPLRWRPEFEKMRSVLRAMEADAEKVEEPGWAAARAG
jgi:DNA-binding winged helix-turn-helix (wHTH) protein/tetratricopeptide (TPR) repeat protein